MENIDNRKEIITCRFGDLKFGTPFFDEDENLCIKVDGVKSSNRLYNAVYLAGGLLLNCDPEEEVVLANAKIVIEN